VASFDSRVRDLAGRAGLRIEDLNTSRARLRFRCDRSSQVLWIYPYDSVWEFSCQSSFSHTDLGRFPQALLAAVLVENSNNKRGFWCLEKIVNSYVLEYMQNFPEYLLTPDEFDKICWRVVKAVDALEAALLPR